jgi:hypothetical protein
MEKYGTKRLNPLTIGGNYNAKACLLACTAAVVCVVLFGVFYMPYYQKRTYTYQKHEKVVYGPLCKGIFKTISLLSIQDADFLTRVEINSMHFEGIDSDCEQSLIFLQTPLWLGTFQDIWKDSYLRVILTADHIALQITYLLTFATTVLIVSVAIVNKIARYLALSKIFSGTRELRAKNMNMQNSDSTANSRIVTTVTESGNSLQNYAIFDSTEN